MYHASAQKEAAQRLKASSAWSRSAIAWSCALGSFFLMSTCTPARSMSVSSSPNGRQYSAPLTGGAHAVSRVQRVLRGEKPASCGKRSSATCAIAATMKRSEANGKSCRNSTAIAQDQG
eukprot:1334242-Pleurochrysis_carterae.AAC.4